MADLHLHHCAGSMGAEWLHEDPRKTGSHSVEAAQGTEAGRSEGGADG